MQGSQARDALASKVIAQKRVKTRPRSSGRYRKWRGLHKQQQHGLHRLLASTGGREGGGCRRAFGPLRLRQGERTPSRPPVFEVTGFMAVPAHNKQCSSAHRDRIGGAAPNERASVFQGKGELSPKIKCLQGLSIPHRWSFLLATRDVCHTLQPRDGKIRERVWTLHQREMMIQVLFFRCNSRG